MSLGAANHLRRPWTGGGTSTDRDTRPAPGGGVARGSRWCPGCCCSRAAAGPGIGWCSRATRRLHVISTHASPTLHRSVGTWGFSGHPQPMAKEWPRSSRLSRPWSFAGAVRAEPDCEPGGLVTRHCGRPDNGIKTAAMASLQVECETTTRRRASWAFDFVAEEPGGLLSNRRMAGGPAASGRARRSREAFSSGDDPSSAGQFGRGWSPSGRCGRGGFGPARTWPRWECRGTSASVGCKRGHRCAGHVASIGIRSTAALKLLSSVQALVGRRQEEAVCAELNRLLERDHPGTGHGRDRTEGGRPNG